MTDKRIREVFTSYDGGVEGVFDQIGEYHYIYSDSPMDALRKEIDEFIEAHGNDPEDYLVKFTQENHADLYQNDELLAEFGSRETAWLEIGYLGRLDLNDPEVFRHITQSLPPPQIGAQEIDLEPLQSGTFE